MTINENHETLAKEDVDFQEMDYSDDGDFGKTSSRSRSISTRNNKQSWKSRYICIQFHKMLALASFPMNNIAFLLFLDVKWHNSESTTLMRYECPAVNNFWRIGCKMFHGKWLRFMSGPKNKGDIVKYLGRMVGSLLQIVFAHTGSQDTHRGVL